MLCVPQHMNEQPISEFGLKPGALWRHDAFGIGHGHEFVNGRGV